MQLYIGAALSAIRMFTLTLPHIPVAQTASKVNWTTLLGLMHSRC
ncbi:hypothetical protein ACLB1N_30280 [Escherichia coli]